MKNPKNGNIKNMDNDIFPIKTAIIEENLTNGRETAMAITVPVENRNGFSFAVAKIKSRSIFAQAVVEIIRDRMTRLAETIQESASLPRRFEQTMEAINEEIAARAAETEVFSPADLNAIIGLAVDKTIFFSGSGEMPSIFLHKLPEGKYQVFNLARSIQNEQAAAGWQKIFVVILDGDLKPGDIFCASNKDLQRELPPEELHSLLAALPPQSAATKLRQYFPLETDLSLFILRVDSDDERPAISAPASLKQLQASREQTKQILSDQKPSLVKTATKLAGPIIKNRRLWWRLIKILWRLLLGSIKIIVFIIRDLGFGSFRLLRRLFSSERKELFSKINTGIRQTINLTTKKTKKIPKTSRYLILAAVVMVAVIIFSVMTVARGREAREARAAFEAAISKVETLQDAASSAMIYKDENKAKNLLTQAEQALDKITTADPENQNQINDLRNDLATIGDKLRRVTEIASPEIIASTTAMENPPDLSAMVLVGGNLYVLGNNKKIYQLNFGDKKLETVAAGEFGAPVGATAEETVAAWLDDKSVINLLDTQTNDSFKAVAAAPEGEVWTDLYAYADRLYVLSPGVGLTSQVYRLSRSGLELGTPTAWIKSPITELSDAISLAVDGTVFVLRSNGKILRFVSGRDVAWAQSVVEPAVTSASDIWTSAESSFVYVLDPTGQRLIVYEKETGNLKTQYHSSNFSGLPDFVVNETEKTIYLLGSNTVWKITTN